MVSNKNKNQNKNNQVVLELEELEREELMRKIELEKLKRKINDTTKKIRDENEFEEKFPIEQVASESLEGLSLAEKEILAVHKGQVVKKNDLTENESEEEKKNKKNITNNNHRINQANLEETISKETFQINSQKRDEMPAEAVMSMNYQQHIKQMSLEPIGQLYSQMKGIYNNSLEKGYVSGQIAEQAQGIQSAIEQKLADVKTGNYQFTSEYTAKAASVALELKDKVSAMYVAGKDQSQQSLYR